MNKIFISETKTLSNIPIKISDFTVSYRKRPSGGRIYAGLFKLKYRKFQYNCRINKNGDIHKVDLRILFEAAYVNKYYTKINYLAISDYIAYHDCLFINCKLEYHYNWGSRNVSKIIVPNHQLTTTRRGIAAAKLEYDKRYIKVDLSGANKVFMRKRKAVFIKLFTSYDKLGAFSARSTKGDYSRHAEFSVADLYSIRKESLWNRHTMYIPNQPIKEFIGELLYRCMRKGEISEELINVILYYHNNRKINNLGARFYASCTYRQVLDFMLSRYNKYIRSRFANLKRR